MTGEFGEFEQWLKQMPGQAEIPFSVDRAGLYRISNLYNKLDLEDPESSWHASFDQVVYRWTLEAASKNPRRLREPEIVAERLHDTAITRGIADFVSGPHKAIGFMGGHDVDRRAPAFRDVAIIARSLRRGGYTIISGGGPGLMEAANFGAFMAPYEDDALDDALATLRLYNKDTDKFPVWVATAAKVRAKLLGKWDAKETSAGQSLGIPTWYYGFEPPNLFASHHGKYFINSVREDGLISIADGGLIFGAGAAGTVQEVFQNTTLNFYRKKGKSGTPMVFLGKKMWGPTPAEIGTDHSGEPQPKPLYPLLAALAAQALYDFTDCLLLTDNCEEATRFISKGGAERNKCRAESNDREQQLMGRAFAVI
jgi:hypothetical protein